MKGRMDRAVAHAAMDPDTDYVHIYQTLLRYEFPWDMKMGLNLAFNRSFSLPHVAAVHVSTGELLNRTQRRIDDTGLLMYEAILGSFSGRGAEAIDRINKIHSRHRIANEDYLYVLAALVVVPLRWLDRYGWRQPNPVERRAVYLFYRDLGTHMGITDIPADLDTLTAWFDMYDARHLRPSEDAARIEHATRQLLIGRIPARFARLSDQLVSALYDPRLRAAVGAPTPSWWLRHALHAALRSRALKQRWFERPPTVPLFAAGIVTKTYPEGYSIAELGPRLERAASEVPS